MVKSEVCSPTMCKDCNSRSGCWHGSGSRNGKHDGFLKVEVPPNSASTSYIAEVWARCGDGGGQWSVKTMQSWFTNGIIDIFVDGKLKKTIKSSGKKESMRKRFDIKGDARIRVSFRPINTAKTAKVSILLMANGVVPIVDDCMSVKEGLEVLGTESDAAFDLRNVNLRQLTCLQSRFEAMSSTLQKKCIEWKGRLSKDQKETLMAFLSAALVKKPSSMVEGQNHQHLQLSLNASRTSLPGCVDPSVDDPESWECECMPSWMKTCSLPANSELSLEQCLRTIMCKDPAVCEGWRDEHCEDSMVDVSATGALDAQRANQDHSVVQNAEMKQRTQISNHVAHNVGVGDGMDGTLQRQIERRGAINSNNIGSIDSALQGKCGSNDV